MTQPAPLQINPNAAMEVHGDRTPSGRRVLGTYSQYSEAQRAVDYLSDNKFAVERTAIVARGLAMVEQVTGRLTWGGVILRGLGSGATTGLLVGLFLSLLYPAVFLLPVILWSIAIGAVIGAILAVVSYAATGGKRDFASVGGMTADHYEVVCDEEVADEAASLLAKMTP